jgi:hypothetical protein
MVQNLHDSTFYVLGRSEARFASQKAELMKLNPTNKIVFLNAQVSLLRDVDTACEQIKKAENKVDFVYMSPGVDMGTALLKGPQCKSASCRYGSTDAGDEIRQFWNPKQSSSRTIVQTPKNHSNNPSPSPTTVVSD